MASGPTLHQQPALRQAELLPSARTLVRPFYQRNVHHIHRGELRMELADGPHRPL
jgi:hypothetical protein